MAKFKFIGQHTGGRNSINASGVDFVGDKASEVTDEDGIRRLRGNPEFVEVGKAKDEKPDQPSEPERAAEANAETHAKKA
ncbi:MAG: hypothetical protein V4527_18095 [Pseudomonadota bacterium]